MCAPTLTPFQILNFNGGFNAGCPILIGVMPGDFGFSTSEIRLCMIIMQQMFMGFHWDIHGILEIGTAERHFC